MSSCLLNIYLPLNVKFRCITIECGISTSFMIPPTKLYLPLSTRFFNQLFSSQVSAGDKAGSSIWSPPTKCLVPGYKWSTRGKLTFQYQNPTLDMRRFPSLWRTDVEEHIHCPEALQGLRIFEYVTRNRHGLNSFETTSLEKTHRALSYLSIFQKSSRGKAHLLKK